MTPAFDLTTVRWVIHAVGPLPRTGGRSTLASADKASLARADEVGARSVAFPSISTGAYGYPADAASRVSVEALLGATTAVEVVLLVALVHRMPS